MMKRKVSKKGGEQLKQLRKKHGFNQTPLSRKLYNNEVTVKQLETGDRNITLYDLWLYSNFFRVPMEKLFVDVQRDLSYEGERV